MTGALTRIGNLDTNTETMPYDDDFLSAEIYP